MDLSDAYFVLRCQTETPLRPISPDHHLVKYRIKVLGQYEDGSEKTAGCFDVWLFYIAAYEEHDGGSLFDLFDADSQEAADLFEVLFDIETQTWREELTPEGFGSDLLYFQSADFPAELRLSPLTLAVAERVIQTLGSGCGYTAIWPWDKPAPSLEDATGEELSAYFDSQSEHESHWSKICFHRVKGSAVLVRDLGLISQGLDAVFPEDG